MELTQPNPNDYYYTYIMRGDTEYEVSAKLYSYGEYDEGYDHLGGYWVEITEDPVFCDFSAFDEFGVELTLTPKELLYCEEHMIETYWNRYGSGFIY